MRRHYTKKEYDELLKSMRIVCQTNEQKNEHILSYFDREGIEFVNRSIPEGDYNLMIKANPELGFPMDTYFFDELFIERKNSLQELAGSLYGQKEMPTYVSRVIDEMKNQKVLNPFKVSQIISSMKQQYAVYDDAFSRELKRAINKPHKYLLVEQPSGWDGILKHDYPNQYNEKAFWGALHSLETRYGLKVKFIDRKNMGLEIYTICKSILDTVIDR